FQQFAGVIFVGLPFLVADVVEVDEHGRASGRGEEQIAEFTQGVGTDYVPVVHDFEGEHVLGFADVNVEMVGPKFDHRLVKLARGVKSAAKDGEAEVGGQVLRFEADDAGDLFVVMGEVAQDGV